MNYADFNSQISIYSQTTASDGAGGRTVTDVWVRDYWSCVTTIMSSKTDEAGRISPVEKYTFVCRNNPGHTVTKENYILYNGKKYSISGIISIAGDAYITFIAYERN